MYHQILQPSGLDSRSLGDEIKLRPNRDTDIDVIIIPDPTKTILSDGIIQAWHIYAKIISIHHSVYLQVWRPSLGSSIGDGAAYTLVGQTYAEPFQLRFQEIVLSAEQFLRVRRGDVLGLYHPRSNPIGWSSVPCASSLQQLKYFRRPTAGNVTVGQSFDFVSTTTVRDDCRAYSFAALFGECFATVPS